MPHVGGSGPGRTLAAPKDRKILAAFAFALLASGPSWAADPDAGNSVDLTPSQAAQIHIAPVGIATFPVEETAVGSIDFDEDRQSQVYPSYQGKILQTFARQGDLVQKGQTLFTVDSPDLVQAESTLISTEGVLRLTGRALARAKDLYHAHGMAQKDYDQAISDQQTADANYRAARDGVRIFGKNDAQIDHILITRKIDPALVVPSPISGVVVSRNAAPGLFVQPGTAPAPFVVADTSVMWMQANAPEYMSSKFAVGQPVAVSVDAYPGRIFNGALTAVGAVIDPATRRFVLRSEIADPDHALRDGMYANFTITTGPPVHSVALPLDGVAREGDGTESVWVTSDRHHFVRKTVTIGREANGYRQILNGLHEGELAVADGAVFLSNMLTAGPGD